MTGVLGISKAIGSRLALAKDSAVCFFFPWSCLFCETRDESNVDGRQDNPWCLNCKNSMLVKDQKRCERCAAIVGQFSTTEGGCIHCRSAKIGFNSATCVGVYEGTLRNAVLSAKWSTSSLLMEALTSILIQEQREHWEDLSIDVVVCVPQSFRRRLVIHFHAAEVIADRISKSIGVPFFSHGLRRSRHPRPQKRVPLSERFRNQHDSITATTPDVFRGKNVLIVDDVLTTGATCTDAARALRKCGAKSCHVAVLGRVLSPGP